MQVRSAALGRRSAAGHRPRPAPRTDRAGVDQKIENGIPALENTNGVVDVAVNAQMAGGIVFAEPKFRGRRRNRRRCPAAANRGRKRGRRRPAISARSYPRSPGKSRADDQASDIGYDLPAGPPALVRTHTGGQIKELVAKQAVVPVSSVPPSRGRCSGMHRIHPVWTPRQRLQDWNTRMLLMSLEYPRLRFSRPSPHNSAGCISRQGIFEMLKHGFLIASVAVGRRHPVWPVWTPGRTI